MLADVRERLLHDAEDLGLARRRQPKATRGIVRRDRRDQLGSGREPHAIPLERADQVVIGRDRAAQAEDRLADVDVDGAGCGRELGQLRPCAIDRADRQELGDGQGLGVDVAQDLGQPVVHLARDPLALGPDRQLTQLPLETVALDGDGCLARQRSEGLDGVHGVGPLRARADRQGPDRTSTAPHRGRQMGEDQVVVDEPSEVGPGQ